MKIAFKLNYFNQSNLQVIRMNVNVMRALIKAVAAQPTKYFPISLSLLATQATQ